MTDREDILSPGIERVITDAIESALMSLHVGLPARVLAFYPSEGTCDVVPCLYRVALDDDDNEVVLEYPPIPRVPVAYQAGGGWAFTFPLAVGSLVYLSFADRSLDAWMVSKPGNTVDPDDSRHHNLSDAIAIASLRPKVAPWPIDPTNMRIGAVDDSSGAKKSPAIVMKPDGTIELGEGAVEPAVLGNALHSALSGLKIDLSGVTPGSGTVTGGGSVSPSQPPTWTFRSTKVKVL